MSQFYYAGHDRQAVGPVSMDELRDLREADKISDNTPVIEEGGVSWRKFGEYRPPAAAGSTAYTPPSPPSSVDFPHDPVDAAAAQASAKAKATALLVRDSVVRTLQAAATPGEKVALFGAVVGVFAFFLPWADAFGESITGFGAAKQASTALFLLPISMVGVCFVSYLNLKASRRDRVLRARWFTVIGAFWCGIALLATLAGRSLFGVASSGLYVTLAASAAVTLGGILQIAEQVAALRE